MVKVPEALLRPYARSKFLARNQLTGPLQQDLQHLKRLLLKLDPVSRFTHLSGVEISLKRAEPDCPVSVRYMRHSVLGNPEHPPSAST
jgi:hypothetical protein